MRTVQELTEELECANVEERRLLDDNLRLRGELDTIRAGFGASMEAFRNHVRNVERERDAALATLSRQGEGDVVERVLAVECPTCGTELGTPCDDFGGDRHVFCASRLRASTPTPAPLLEGPRLRPVVALLRDVIHDFGNSNDKYLRFFHCTTEPHEVLGHVHDVRCNELAIACADAIQAHLGSAPRQHAGLDPATAEACAKVADEWANDGATADSKLTGRSIAGRIRTLTNTPGTPGKETP